MAAVPLYLDSWTENISPFLLNTETVIIHLFYHENHIKSITMKDHDSL